jgi:hypothetical protein
MWIDEEARESRKSEKTLSAAEFIVCTESIRLMACLWQAGCLVQAYHSSFSSSILVL